jgi:Putative MetA-pathway of phenol degradation
MKNYIFLFFLALSQTISAQYTDIINSNRPSESMSAFAVGRTVIQVESGLNYAKENYNDLNYDASGIVADFTVRYGFFKEMLETILEVSYQSDKYTSDTLNVNRKGIKATTIGLKYLIFDPFKYQEENVNLYSWKANNKFSFSQLIPIVSVYGGANLNFSANQFVFGKEKLDIVSPKIMAITQNIFGKQYVFITNTFLDKIGTNGQNFGYLLTLTKGFNEKWSAFVENKGLFGKTNDAYLSAGGAYLIHSNLQVDVSVSKNFKDTPSFLYAGVGVSWRSDSNYKDFLVATPEKAKELKEKKNRKKKGNDKKLLDRLPAPAKDDK